jgi:hypothetical protein
MLSAARCLHHLFECSQDTWIGPYGCVTDNQQDLIARVQD